MKKLVHILLAGIIATSVFSAAACTPKRPRASANTLNIYCVDLGYKTEWLDAVIAAFKKEAWVQEKYPNLVVLTPTTNDIRNYANQQLDAGEGSNEYSILFGQSLNSYSGIDYAGVQNLADLTDTVYNAYVPGENVLYKDKITSSYKDFLGYKESATSEVRYYTTPWASGMDSIIYNEDALNELGLQMPVTTEEFKAACRKAKTDGFTASDGRKVYYPIVQGKEIITYFDYMFHTWWAQYEGIQGYINFWNGIDSGAISKRIFQQEGRKYSAKFIEEIVDYDTGWLNPTSFTVGFMEGQLQMLEGFGLFQANGDWFDSEMAELKSQIKAEGGRIYNIKMMPTPIVSQIRDFTPSITSDPMLAQVIRAIDDGATSYAGVTQDDFDIILEARSVIQSIGAYHTAAIPNYALSKEVATDFLRFMATDKAQIAYITATNGASLPFEFDFQTKAPALYNSISVLQKSKFEYFNSTNFDVYALPGWENYPLAKYGGVSAFADTSSLATTFAQNGNQKTAETFYNGTLDVWTNDMWNEAIQKAGIV